MRIDDPNTFALAVIQSSDPNMTVEKKIKLYIEAKEQAKEHNRKNPAKGGSVKGF